MIAVLGAGGWGTALAVHLVRTGHDAWLWGRDAALVAELSTRRANAVYLPDITFPPKLQVTAELAEALRGAEIVVVAVPSHGMREVLRRAAPLVQQDAMVVSAAKGLERGTLAPSGVEGLFRPSEIIEQELAGGLPRAESSGARVGVLSGPSFAAEMARELPTAVCIASTDSHNAQAGLITRGLAEIARLACAAGAQRETLAGLTGLGDLVLTCTGALSRNRHVGIELARGRALPDVLAGMKMVAEGVRTTDAALALAARHGVELPIAAQVAELLAGRKDARTALYDLMVRPQKAESA